MRVLGRRARGAGRSKRDFANYRFQDEGEEQLRAWMAEHLTYGFAPVEGDLEKIEKDLIAELKPPLNLTHRKNPQKSRVQELRKACRQEAAGT